MDSGMAIFRVWRGVECLAFLLEVAIPSTNYSSFYASSADVHIHCIRLVEKWNVQSSASAIFCVFLLLFLCVFLSLFQLIQCEHSHSIISVVCSFRRTRATGTISTTSASAWRGRRAPIRCRSATFSTLRGGRASLVGADRREHLSSLSMTVGSPYRFEACCIV